MPLDPDSVEGRGNPSRIDTSPDVVKAPLHPVAALANPSQRNGPDQPSLRDTYHVEDEAAALLLNVSAAPVVKTDSKAVMDASFSPNVISHLHTPPDDQSSARPATTATSIAPPLQIAADDHSRNALTPGTDAATSPAYSGAASATPSKPRNKRKRNAIAGPSRQTSVPAVPIDIAELPHFLGQDNTFIRCICGFVDDDGFTIQCDRCGAWEHGQCFGYASDEFAPQDFFCELCDPRPVDREYARNLQMNRLRQLAAAEEAEAAEAAEDNVEPVKPGRPKGRRPKSETKPPRDDSKDSSPGAMKPPPVKPKRRPTANKPRSNKQGASESTPIQQSAKPTEPVSTPVPNVASTGHELDHPYFRVRPWQFEYTPVQSNVVWKATALKALARLEAEWIHEENEGTARSRRESVDNATGFPSPTNTSARHGSPDVVFPPSDFSILAPPVPPVSLMAPDLDELGASISVKAVKKTPSFLPLSYTEVSSGTGVYSHPALYCVHATDKISAGTFIGEMRGEIVDRQRYHRDPINQYRMLGLPKPFVRALGPPVNLMLDCRGYGTELRFVRSSCHPNAVIRPILHRKTETSRPRLCFGVFASIDITRRTEITLGWDWDDSHIVHALQSLVQPNAQDDGTVSDPLLAPVDFSIRSMAQKFDTVLTTLYGTFASCACPVSGSCALAQMKFIVEYVENLEDQLPVLPADEPPSHAADLGKLVGAVRGWRRQEIEEKAVQQSQHRGASPKFRKRTMSERQELGMATANAAIVSRGSSRSVSRSVDPQTEVDDFADGMDVDQDPEELDEEAGLEEQSGSEADTEQMGDSERNAAGSAGPSRSKTEDAEEQDDRMDIDAEDLPNRSSENRETDATAGVSPPLTSPPDVPTTLPASDNGDNESMDGTTPAGPSPSSRRDDLQSRLFTPSRQGGSRTASPDGHASDATAPTEPGSAFSEDEDDEIRRPPTPPPHVDDLVPKKKKSPTPEEEKSFRYDHPPIVKHLHTGSSSPEPPSELPTLPNEADYDDTEIVVEATPEDIAPSRLWRKEAKSSSSGSRPSLSRKKSTKAKSGRKTGRKGRASSSDLRKSVKIELTPEDFDKPPVTDEIQLDIPKAPEVKPEPERVPTPPPKDPTPPPKEPTPPPKPPTPPPRRITMSEYLKANSIKKKKDTEVVPPPEAPVVESAPATTPLDVKPNDPSPAPVQPALPEAIGNGLPGFKHYSPQKLTAVLPPAAGMNGSRGTSPVKQQPAGSNGFDLADFLPSSRGGPPTSAPIAESPAITPSTSITPGLGLTRTDYFPQQSTTSIPPPASYVPRKSSSYVPRPQLSTSVSTEASSAEPGLSSNSPYGSSYQPRPSPMSDHNSLPPFTPYPESSTATIPPPATRDLPPHARAPPTGPKVPPTGPRTSGGSVGSSFNNRDRDRDWDRDRDRMSDRDRDRERERDRDRDREPVSPRATFGPGSARGGAPIAVPFHRGRGRGGFRGGRGGW